ncbi:MAG: pyrimidine 5'-nucleotidase [Solirubrobacterales bacterium]
MDRAPAPDHRRLGLGHVDSWVFDLDNTLYPASSSLFPQIDVRMRQFIADRLGMDLDAAYRLQKRYYREFGTTLRGLMLVHGIEPAAFLEYVHDIDHSVLAAAPVLDRALAGLPGRKLIFTNGTERHAVNVLDRLGIAHHFEGIFDIVAAEFLPKPQPDSYRMMVERHGVDARSAAMVEDLHRNLVPAEAIGMTTVWVREIGHPDAALAMQDDGDLSHVHHITDDLAPWLAALG